MTETPEVSEELMELLQKVRVRMAEDYHALAQIPDPTANGTILVGMNYMVKAIDSFASAMCARKRS